MNFHNCPPQKYIVSIKCGELWKAKTSFALKNKHGAYFEIQEGSYVLVVEGRNDKIAGSFVWEGHLFYVHLIHDWNHCFEKI